jgi:hypothetical protein
MKTLKYSLRIFLVLALLGYLSGILPGAVVALAVFVLPGAFDFQNVYLSGDLCVTSTSTRFQNTPCTVVVANNYDTHGTITRASVAHLTPSQLEDLFRPSGLFADMDAWFKTSFEMKACGTKINGLYDWLMSSVRQVGKLVNEEKVDRGPSLLFPYVLARQDSVINADEFWAITGGQANSAYTAGVTGPLTADDKLTGVAGDRVVRVVTRYGFDLNAAWFLSRDRVNIFGKNGAGSFTNGQWRVLASAVDANLSYIDVLLTSENAGSSTPYDTAPTAGVLLAAGNNVNDYEAYCLNRPTLDGRKRVPFWYQTMRRARRVDSEYKKVFARLMESNEYFRQFGDLPLAERNRQDEMIFQRRWLNSFFFGKAISANQTLANWQSLEAINSVNGSVLNAGQGGKLMAYRANMIGVYEQMRACGRVIDLQNNPLNLYEFLDECYRILRARKSQGRNTSSLDWYTDSTFAANFESAVIAYYRREYGDIVRINIETGGNELGFHWKSYNFKFPAGVTINIITHEYFDDMVSAFDAESLASSGRVLWCLDMGKGGTIYPGMIATNKKMRTLGEIEKMAALDPTLACVMESPTEEISLVSETVTAIVECPANSLMIMGIADAIPITTGKSLNPTYANLY